MYLTPIQQREAAVQNAIAAAHRADDDVADILVEALGRVLLARNGGRHFSSDAEAAAQHLRDVLTGEAGHGGVTAGRLA